MIWESLNLSASAWDQSDLSLANRAVETELSVCLNSLRVTEHYDISDTLSHTTYSYKNRAISELS